MILQLHIQALNTPTAIYRTVLIPDGFTFDDLGTVIESSFDIMHSESYIFNMITSNGEKQDYIFIGIDYENDFLISKEEILDDEETFLYEWFQKGKDEAIYTVAVEEYELKIEVQKILEPDSTISYPLCIDAKGRMSQTDTEQPVDLEEINEDIQLGELLSSDRFDEVMKDTLEETPDWQTLFQVADQLKKLKPWQYFDDNQIVAIQDPFTKEIYFCSVLGGAGMEYGLAIYIGAKGWKTINDIMSDQTTDDFFYQLDSLCVYYVNRDELEKSDYELIKEQELSFRGEHNWIQFRSYKPGFVPWHPDVADTKTLILVLQQMIQLVEQCKNGWQLPFFEDSSLCVTRHIDSHGEWIESVFQIKDPLEEDVQIYPALSDFEIVQIKKKKHSNLKLEFELFYLPQAVEDPTYNRPFFPVFCVAIDRNTGMVCYQQILPPQINAAMAQGEFVYALKQLSVRPQTLFVTPKINHYLEPLAQKLNITLKSSEPLVEIQQFKNYMRYQ
ncbi:DUF7309 domain-containing protein [Rummeliibacillus suwonensis]|uniref:DUF7309 domain-containing protein n=1 Tax=Rummeliibacillus suwonensis TaxID=1306154 RepID=UPI00289F5BD1|nr:hypothetical protein [Rummeliibacillus suwonensis]